MYFSPLFTLFLMVRGFFPKKHIDLFLHFVLFLENLYANLTEFSNLNLSYLAVGYDFKITRNTLLTYQGVDYTRNF